MAMANTRKERYARESSGKYNVPFATPPSPSKRVTGDLHHEVHEMLKRFTAKAVYEDLWLLRLDDSVPYI